MVFIYILCLFNLLLITEERKWSIEDLVKQVKSWNYLNDPEEFIKDKQLGPKIHTSYLQINKVYEKTDINLFYLTDVIEKYIYKRRQFVEDLYEAMLNSTEIDNTTMKKHHLFLVFFIKHKELIIYGSSQELRRLLPKEKVLQIEMEMKKVIENYKNTPAQIIYVLFDKLEHLWKRFDVFTYNKKQENKNNKTFNNVKDIFGLIFSLGISFGLCFILCYKKKDKDKQD